MRVCAPESMRERPVCAREISAMMAECDTARMCVRGRLSCMRYHLHVYMRPQVCVWGGQCFSCLCKCDPRCVHVAECAKCAFQRGKGVWHAKHHLCADETGVWGAQHVISCVCRCDLSYMHLTGHVTVCACQRGRCIACVTPFVCADGTSGVCEWSGVSPCMSM